MAKTPQSRKGKGRRLQQAIRDSILERFEDLEPDDVRSTSMGAGGEDLLLSPAARRKLPLSIEAKNQERLSIWKAHEQAEANCPEGSAPAVIFKRNYSDVYISMKLEDFLDKFEAKNSDEE